MGGHRREREWNNYSHRRTLHISGNRTEPGDGHRDGHIVSSDDAGIGHCRHPDPDCRGNVHRNSNGNGDNYSGSGDTGTDVGRAVEDLVSS
jgi:hypothetical protein